jgi:hypothetical protein
MHALRHLYASVLLDAGESIKALSGTPATQILASPSASIHHLLSSSYERTRKAVDGLLLDATDDEDEAA